MRFLNVCLGDFKFQRKYGIWLVYTISTLLYILILSLVPSGAKRQVGLILVYTDPVAMGLFFMGAILLLEKSQRINSSIAVSPVTKHEYTISKALTLMITGTIVGTLVLCFGSVPFNFFTILGLMLSSLLFSLCGLIVATKCKSINQFLIGVVPFEMVIFIPSIAYLFGACHSDWYIFHPGVATIRLLIVNEPHWLLCIISLIAWICVIYYFCYKSVKKLFLKIGG